jgi:competence protein ComEC
LEQGGATRMRAARRGFPFAPLRTPAALRLRWRGGEIGAAFRDALECELAERAGFQWLAVAFGAGCLVYFVLPREPVFVMLAMAALVAGGVAMIGHRRGRSWRAAALLAACFAGASAAKLRVDGLDAPQVERPFAAELTGRVVDRDHRTDRRPRIVLDRLASASVAPADMPRKVRVTLGAKAELPPLGSRVALRARLMPVPGPAAPGGYDPRRAAFFEGIGASAFVLGTWRLEAEPQPSLDLAVARVRAAMVARIMAAEPGEAGAVAAALLVGERSALSAETTESLRASGLAHILSISGLHMMLIGGAAYLFVRAGLALSPALALSRPIRKWAAVAALVVVTAYLALSGGGAATMRAWIMAAIMFVAILVDRPPISMRNLAIAAFVVLALEPENVTEPGFQMSFAAVAALIAGWDAWSERRRLRLTDADAMPGQWAARWLARAVFGVALTTLLAGLATAPFAAYHFERVASYSLIGNLLAAPLVSAIVMPAGLLTLVLMPFGLEGLPLWGMARGIEAMLAVSDWVARLPGAEVAAPPITPAGLLLIASGMLWLCLWRLRWRLLGWPAVGLGLLLGPLLHDSPDILVAADGRVVAVRDTSGVLRVSGGKAGSYMIGQIFDEEGGPPEAGADLRKGVRCDELGCILPGAGAVVAHVLDAGAFPEDCDRAEIVVSPLEAPRSCRAALVIDAARLARSGAHELRYGLDGPSGGIDVTMERSAFPRPWQAGGGSAGDE